MGRWGHGCWEEVVREASMEWVVWCWWAGGLSAEEAAVPHGESSVAVHPHLVLMILHDFYDHSSLVPLCWVTARLVLDEYVVTTTKGGEATRVFIPSCSAEGLTVG